MINKIKLNEINPYVNVYRHVSGNLLFEIYDSLETAKRKTKELDYCIKTIARIKLSFEEGQFDD